MYMYWDRDTVILHEKKQIYHDLHSDWLAVLFGVLWSICLTHFSIALTIFEISVLKVVVLVRAAREEPFVKQCKYRV